jgi:hypothetical protein
MSWWWNREKHDAAFSAYDDQSWDLLGTLLGLISKTRRLASREIQTQLESLYQTLVLGIDNEVLQIRAAEEGEALATDRWRELQGVLFGDMRSEIDEILTALAVQLRLSGSEPETSTP